MKKFDGGNMPLGECESQRTLQFEAGLPVLRRVSGLADPAVGYSVPCMFYSKRQLPEVVFRRKFQT